MIFLLYVTPLQYHNLLLSLLAHYFQFLLTYSQFFFLKRYSALAFNVWSSLPIETNLNADKKNPVNVLMLTSLWGYGTQVPDWHHGLSSKVEL